MDIIKDQFHGLSPDGPLCMGAAEADRITLAEPLVHSFVFSNAGKAVITFHTDGRVTADPDMKPDEAAQKVIDYLIAMWPAAIGKTQ